MILNLFVLAAVLAGGGVAEPPLLELRGHQLYEPVSADVVACKSPGDLALGEWIWSQRASLPDPVAELGQRGCKLLPASRPFLVDFQEEVVWRRHLGVKHEVVGRFRVARARQESDLSGVGDEYFAVEMTAIRPVTTPPAPRGHK